MAQPPAGFPADGQPCPAADAVNGGGGGSSFSFFEGFDALAQLVQLLNVESYPVLRSEGPTVILDVPLLVNMQPAGAYLGEDYYRAGSLPAVVAGDRLEGSVGGLPVLKLEIV